MLKFNPLRICFAVVLFLYILFPLYSQEGKHPVAEYIATYKNVALKEMQLFKIPASITLGQGILESSMGNSELAVNANNHFGIKCKAEWTGDKYYYDDDEKDECFRKYNTAQDSYRDHSLFLTMRDRYAALFTLDITDYKGWARGLKQAGYATEPNYAEMLIKCIEDNKLYELDIYTGPFYDGIAQDTINQKNPILITDCNRRMIMNNNDNPDFQDIILSDNSRRIGQINSIRYIYARSGDTYKAIAEDFGLTSIDITFYNDFDKYHIPATGEVVFIEAKKDSGPDEYHIVAGGETMHGISQRYGVKLHALYKKNHLKAGTEAVAGQKLYLQKSAPVY